eukprot:9169035-Alexandrium_andersonii.AAC.1
MWRSAAPAGSVLQRLPAQPRKLLQAFAAPAIRLSVYVRRWPRVVEAPLQWSRLGPPSSRSCCPSG